MNLRPCPLFNEFTADELSILQALALRAVLEAGEWSFHENDPADTLLVILAGTLRISRQSPEGGDEELAQLSTGAHLGEMAMLGHGRRSASAQALERSQIALLPYDALRATFARHPALAAKFYQAVAASLVRRLQNMNANVAFLKTFLKTRA